MLTSFKVRSHGATTAAIFCCNKLKVFTWCGCSSLYFYMMPLPLQYNVIQWLRKKTQLLPHHVNGPLSQKISKQRIITVSDKDLSRPGTGTLRRYPSEVRGGSRIPRRRGRQPSRRAPTYDFAKISEKLHENENILGCRGRAPGAPP